MIVVEYLCPHCDRFEYIEPIEAQEHRDCPSCGTIAPYVISAPAIKPNYGSTTQGKGSTERPKDFVSTSAIADGMSHNEYRAKHAAARKERLRKHIKDRIG